MASTSRKATKVSESINPVLRTEEKNEAVEQMIAHCRLLMEQSNAGVSEYAVVSARGVLNELGFGDNVDEILQFIADGGFDYCLDSRVEHNGECPPRSACYWGADQLESRLHWVVRR